MSTKKTCNHVWIHKSTGKPVTAEEEIAFREAISRGQALMHKKPQSCYEQCIAIPCCYCNAATGEPCANTPSDQVHFGREIDVCAKLIDEDDRVKSLPS